MEIEEIFNIPKCIVGNYIPKKQLYEFGDLKSRDKSIFTDNNLVCNFYKRINRFKYQLLEFLVNKFIFVDIQCFHGNSLIYFFKILYIIK